MESQFPSASNSSSSSPNPSPNPSSSSPLFLPPSPSLSAAPSSSGSPSSSSPSSDQPAPLEVGLSGVFDGPAPSGPDQVENSGTPSNGEKVGKLAGRANLEKAAAKAVTTATGAMHELLADEEEKAHGLYLAYEEEVEGISEAAAGLLSRRVPAGVGNPDLADVVQLAMVLGGYILRTWRTRQAIRRARLGSAVNVDQGANLDQGHGV